jgi:hypothetical protein
LPAIQRRRAFLQDIPPRGDRVAQPLGLGLLSAQLIGERRQLGSGQTQLFAALFEVGLNFTQSLKHRAFLDLKLRKAFFFIFDFFPDALEVAIRLRRPRRSRNR